MSPPGSGSPPGRVSESSASAANITAPEIEISADVSAAASALPDEQDLPLCSWCEEHSNARAVHDHSAELALATEDDVDSVTLGLGKTHVMSCMEVFHRSRTATFST